MSAEYSLFDALVEHKDILDRVLFDFLDTKDLVALDSASLHVNMCVCVYVVIIICWVHCISE